MENTGLGNTGLGNIDWGNRGVKLGRQRGFTLIEVMVAVGVFAILGMGAYRLLSGEIRTQERVRAHSESLRQWQRALQRLERDLVQLTARPVRDNYGAIEPALSGTSEHFVLTRGGWPNPLQRLRSHSQRVHYELEPDDSDKDNDGAGAPKSLVRRYWPVLDRAQDSEPLRQRLLPRIESISIRYLAGDGEWHNQWPPLGDQLPTAAAGREAFDTALPAAMEIRLVNPVYGEITRLFALGDLMQEQNPQ